MLHCLADRLGIDDATTLSFTVLNGSIEPKLTMVVSELAHLDMQVTIKEDAYSYQDAVNEATNDAVKKIESILRQQYVVGDEYQDITETPEALEIIQLLRVLLEGYKGPSRGCGCEDIIDEIVAWFKDQVKTCHSLNEVRSALEEDFF